MENSIDQRPQDHCLMCGKCCKVVITAKSYKALLRLRKKGNQFAQDFLAIFEPYPSIEAARKASAEIVDNILTNLETAINVSKDITFYKCKHLSDKNLCEIYEKRPLLCTRFPASPWALIPPGCGFEGWLSEKREDIKQKIRYQKQCMAEFEEILKTTEDPKIIKKLETAIKKIKKTIALFSKYGSEDW